MSEKINESKALDAFSKLIKESSDKYILEAVNKAKVEDLVIFIENEGKLYTRVVLPSIKMLAKKIKAGKFDRKLALKQTAKIADEGAKEYHKQFGEKGTPWNVMFSKEERAKAAEDLLDGMMQEAEFMAQQDKI